MKWWFKQQLYIQIAIGVAIGIVLGLILGPNAEILKPIGDIFINLLQFLVVPLTFFCLIAGVTKMEDIRALRSVGSKIGIYFVVTAIISTTIGIVVALIINPGKRDNRIT